MIRSKIWIFVFCVCNFGPKVNATCPEDAALRPCSCRSVKDGTGDDFEIITCNGLQSEDALESVLRSSKGHKVFELRLVESNLRYLPENAFIGTSFEVLSIENSSISALSESEKALRGLEDSLRLIEIMNCSFAGSWDWTQLSELRQVMEVLVHDSQMQQITEDISHMKHIEIEAFAFQRNEIRWVDDYAFAPFTKLNRLTLDGNHLTEFKRSMLPMPAFHLNILGLSNNNLKSLPHDLFAFMPALTSLYLTGNPLHTIEEIVFKPIWHQIHLFLFSGTPLSCDCRLAWLTQLDNSKKYIHAICQKPSQFKGRNLISVEHKELMC